MRVDRLAVTRIQHNFVGGAMPGATQPPTGESERHLPKDTDTRFKTVVGVERRRPTGGTSLGGAPADDIAPPETAFVDTLSHRDHFGILSEDRNAATGAPWGDFPRTCLIADVIDSAMRSSRSWEEAWCLDL